MFKIKLAYMLEVKEDKNMEIIIKSRNKEERIISIFDLEKELSKVISTKSLDLKEIEMKLQRGDLLGLMIRNLKKSIKDDKLGKRGISDNASEKEKIKAEYSDMLHGLNSCGNIDYTTYEELWDFGMKLLDKMYEFAKKEGEKNVGK